jgi:hypothetical protein
MMTNSARIVKVNCSIADEILQQIVLGFMKIVPLLQHRNRDRFPEIHSASLKQFLWKEQMTTFQIQETPHVVGDRFM